MVKYVSAASSKSFQSMLNEIAPDFNNKLSAILKSASNPTWDLTEMRNKEPQEFNVVYISIPDPESPNNPDKVTDFPIYSTVKMFYRGITDTDKEFYVSIEKTMCVRGFEDISDLLSHNYLKLIDKEHYEVPVEHSNDILNYVQDWRDWVDAPNRKAMVELQYNGGSMTDAGANKVETIEVPPEQIDETIQKFVDKYIDVE